MPDEKVGITTLDATNGFEMALVVVSVPPTYKLTMASAETRVALGFERLQRWSTLRLRAARCAMFCTAWTRSSVPTGWRACWRATQPMKNSSSTSLRRRSG